MEEDLKMACATALIMAMWDAYYGHQDEELLEKVILANLDFLIQGIKQEGDSDE